MRRSLLRYPNNRRCCMRKYVFMFVTIGAMAGFAAPVLKADEAKAAAPATKTLQGEVLDMACYMDHGASGAKHAQCAADCIKGGSPMGLLTKDGQVYLLVENHAKKDSYANLKKWAGQ